MELKKVAMVADYGVNCGIATYTKYLCDAMRVQACEVKIFAERAEPEACQNDGRDNVVRCWKRNEDYLTLVEEIRKYDPDIVFIQHEFGLWHKMNMWSSLLTQLSRIRTVVVLHTVLEHDVQNNAMRQDYLTRALAEAPCSEIIVHSKKARATLRSRGYAGRVHFIPHGSFEPKPSKLPATKYGMWPSHSIFQYGFGGKYKGWDIALEVTEKLKAKYPDVMYIGMYNVNDKGIGAQTSLFYELIDSIEKKGLQDNVALIRGYQTDEMIANYIKSCRVALFPYQRPNKEWASWGASGAIQLPMSLGIPMVLSDYCAFQEYEGLLPLCKKVDDYVREIDKIFSDNTYERHLQKVALDICASRTWKKCAEWYLNCPPNKDFDAW